MKTKMNHKIPIPAALLAILFILVPVLPCGGGAAQAQVNIQCPVLDPNAVCRSLTGGDGYVTMADGRVLYTFGFSDVTGVPDDQVMNTGMLAANFPAPTLVFDEGDDAYVSLTNVGMVIRPDLFDPHSVHWHGFANASAIFDGLPDASIAIHMGATLTYFYHVTEAGTYMYHCHVEAAEHMQMGMLGNLYVRPAQNRLPNGTLVGTHVHSNPDWNATRKLDDPLVGDKYAYNDGDGSTLYDVEYALQLGSFDPNFHDADETVQPLPFEFMKDRYPMINGRGYPDTVFPAPLAPPSRLDEFNQPYSPNGGVQSQPVDSLIVAPVGQKLLLRLSNLSVTHFYTVATTGLPMQVVGVDARQVKGAGGLKVYHKTLSVTLGGGESTDVIIDTTGVPPGRYFLYTTNLNYLSNDAEDFGGMMTEIRIGL